MSGIFISYRRYDSAVYARLLYDRLSRHFGEGQVFMDIEEIEPGEDFIEAIEREVGSCDALVALIGNRWLTIADASGSWRLDDPEDLVRLEIATALERSIRVIPVLVGDATMPRSADLPDPLKRLARRNALEITHVHFDYDVDRLIEVLEGILPPPPVPIEPQMIRIPRGKFLMGSKPRQRYAQHNEQPQHALRLPTYYIAGTPVTNAQYARFVRDTDYDQPTHWESKYGRPPRGREDHPVVYVSWREAVAYCHWLSSVTGKPYRLPSEAEWEKAARGTDGRAYPWGRRWYAGRCNNADEDWDDTSPVGSYLRGASPYGLLDMAGNVWEWTRSLWGEDSLEPDFEYPYNARDGRENPRAGDDMRRVLRGGSFVDVAGDVRCAVRHAHLPYRRFRNVGFRVAASRL